VDRGTFLSAAAALGAPVDDAALERLLRFRAILEEGNRRAALTTRTDEADFLEIHALDSLTLARALAGEPSPLRRLIDIGTGAGFPAIPLALVYPDLEVHAVESIQKKGDFLRHASTALGLDGRFHVHLRRAEEAGREPALRDSFDLAVARAVSALPILAELCLPFVRPGGLFVAWKGAKAEQDEVPPAAKAFSELAASLEGVIDSGIAGRDLRLIKVRKTGPTPERYPRRTGVPEKRPLG
jgi:16S rRNA (guanine527-N7)-methyltransferase